MKPPSNPESPQRPRRRPGLIAALAAVLLASAGARAGNLAAVPMTMTPIYMNTAIGLGMIDATRRSLEAHSAAQSRPVPAPRAAADAAARSGSPSAAAVSFAVGTDAAISGQAWHRFEDTLRTSADASAVASMIDTFVHKPVRAAYLEAASPYGLGDRDLRDVVSAYLVTGWMISNQAQLPTRAQVNGVRRQIAMAMQERPPAAAAGNRQMAAELMMYELVSLIYARQEGLQTGNRPALQAIATRTADSLRERGFDPLRVGLTDQGFVPR